MYSGYALHISVTNFCNSLPWRRAPQRRLKAWEKNINSGKWILLMTFKKKKKKHTQPKQFFATKLSEIRNLSSKFPVI